MENQYKSGEYWGKNSSFHEEDSDFKFKNLVKLIHRNSQIEITGIVDMGCGAGRITWNFSNEFPNVTCLGIDLDPSIICYANSKYKNKNLIYQSETDKSTIKTPYNLIVLADVFEHIEDYISFLKGVRENYSYQLFNIPLDLSVRTLLSNQPIEARNTFGHLHYFYDKLALRILEDAGFTVIDYLYTDNISFEGRKKKGMERVTYSIKSIISRMVCYIVGPSKTSVIFGYSSLSVLCKTSSM